MRLNPHELEEALNKFITDNPDINILPITDLFFFIQKELSQIKQMILEVKKHEELAIIIAKLTSNL